MERITLRIPKQQVDECEELVEQGVFPSRSEAIRAFVRQGLNRRDEGDDARPWAKV